MGVTDFFVGGVLKVRGMWIVLMLLAGVAFPGTVGIATGSSTLFNDTGVGVYGLRVVFDNPVTIVRMGDRFANWTSEKDGTIVLFSEGKITIWGDFYFFWEPADVRLVSYQWLLEPPGPGEERENVSQTLQVEHGALQIGTIVKVSRSQSSLPYTYYYYVPGTASRSSTATLLHIATASAPLNSLDEADDRALGQLDLFVSEGLAESSGLIMFSVAVPQMIIGYYKSGCANHLLRYNFERRKSEGIYYRPDLNFMQVLEHFRTSLEVVGFHIDSQIFVAGFSTGGVWAHKFALLHPSLVKGVACGGNGIYTMPVESYQGTPLPYSLGIQDLPQLGLGQFDLESFRGIPFFVFIGDKDTNTPLVRGRESGSSRFDMSVEQIVWYLNAFGDSLQERSRAFHEELLKLGMNSTFKEYRGVGHYMTEQMKNDAIEFFLSIPGLEIDQWSTKILGNIGLPGAIMWSGSLRSGSATEIEITIYDEDYISWENGGATARFAVIFDSSLGWGNVVQDFPDKKKWRLRGLFYEEVQVPLVRSGAGMEWLGTVTIVPCTSIRYLSVLQPPQPDCQGFVVRPSVDAE